jgi:hypothetical protein
VSVIGGGPQSVYVLIRIARYPLWYKLGVFWLRFSRMIKDVIMRENHGGCRSPGPLALALSRPVARQPPLHWLGFR